MRRLAIIGLCCILTGCSGLLIRDDDTGLQKAGKVTVRSLYCILTLPAACASEWAVMKDIKDDEQLFARYEPRRPLVQTEEAQSVDVGGQQDSPL